MFAGPVDTDMTRGLDIPKTSAESVAQAIFDGLEKEEEDIFPDPMSQQIAEGWRKGAAKALEQPSRRRARRGRRSLAKRRQGVIQTPSLPGGELSMCPFYLSTLGLVVASTVSTGGLAALAVKISRKKHNAAETTSSAK